jgi:hypothetical protein
MSSAAAGAEAKGFYYGGKPLLTTKINPENTQYS